MPLDRVARVMFEAADFALLRPYWLLALPLVAALAWVARRQQAELGDWSRQIDAHLMQAMERLGRVERSGRRAMGLAGFLAAGLVALALTGPAAQRGQGQSFRNLDGVVFVLDVSRSMTRDSRWQDVVALARAGLSALGTRPAALIVFAGDSYEAATLTTDHLQVGQTIALLDDETVPDPGSRPALALGQAARMLGRADILAGRVVLFSDGGGVDPASLVAADELAAQGARLLLARVDTDQGDAQGLARLEEVASVESLSVGEIDRFMSLMGDTANSRLEAQSFGLAIWTDYGRFLLGLALIPLVGMFRRSAL